MEVVSTNNEFSIVEIRIIQSLWEKKPPEYIATMLQRTFTEVELKIKELSRKQKVKLYQRSSFEKKVSKTANREKEWAKRQMEKKEIKIRKVDESSLISVRIDSKTIVKVAPGTDIEELKKKYKRKGFYE